MGRISLKVVPGSSRDEVVGWLGDSLKVKVEAPPEKGRANEAVVALLADRLGVDASSIAVVSGQGDTADEAISDVQSAIHFHIDTFGMDAFAEDSLLLHASMTEPELVNAA
jgi:hypothetical protein